MSKNFKKIKLSDRELERYARHIVLREVGGLGQVKLSQARVLVVGAGGLGAPILQYLIAAGIGMLAVIDADCVSLSNLQRQVLFRESDIGYSKVDIAQNRLTDLNPHVQFLTFNKLLDANNAIDLIADFDLVLDGSDNAPTRYAVNAACVAVGVALISGAINQWEGQVVLLHPAQSGACYACLFPQITANQPSYSCSHDGVVAALPGIIGSIMALEAIKWITNAANRQQGQLLIFDGLYGQSRTIIIKKRADCSVCGCGSCV